VSERTGRVPLLDRPLFLWTSCGEVLIFRGRMVRREILRRPVTPAHETRPRPGGGPPCLPPLLFCETRWKGRWGKHARTGSI